MLKGSRPHPVPRERLRVDKLDSLMGSLGHGPWPQPCHALGVSKCVLAGPRPCQNQARPAPGVLGHLFPSLLPDALPILPQPPLRFGVLFTQNCKCLVVTMTYCLGQCSFPMHTNILWLLYMNIFNDMGKVVDFLFLKRFFFSFFFWRGGLEL